MPEPQLVVFLNDETCDGYYKVTLKTRVDDSLKDTSVLAYVDLSERKKVGGIEDLLPIAPTFNFGHFVIKTFDNKRSAPAQIYAAYEYVLNKMHSAAELCMADFYTIGSTFSYSNAFNKKNTFVIFPTGQLLMEKRLKQ